MIFCGAAQLPQISLRVAKEQANQLAVRPAAVVLCQIIGQFVVTERDKWLNAILLAFLKNRAVKIKPSSCGKQTTIAAMCRCGGRIPPLPSKCAGNQLMVQSGVPLLWVIPAFVCFDRRTNFHIITGRQNTAAHNVAKGPHNQGVEVLPYVHQLGENLSQWR